MPRNAALRIVAVFLGASVALAACSGDDDDEYVERPVVGLYNTALDELQAGEYESAAKSFSEVERQHPYSVWATKAQLMAAYAQYQGNSYDDAIISLDRFIQLHPSNADVAYAYYLKALSYYEQISDVGRDQQITRLALKALVEMLRRFPNSKYAGDVRLKIDLTRDHLAGKEMDIGRYYLTQGQYLAAVNRFKIVIDNYQSTTHVAEALHRLVEAYLALGIDNEARKAAAVLGHNFPGSEWYIDSYEIVEDKPFRRKKAESPWYWPFGDDEEAKKFRPLKDAKEEKEEKDEKPWYWPF
jgi:outer membrane protein assembly factor BamD